METERLIIDYMTKGDKEDFFINISHDKKVLETFMCQYQETLEDFDFDKYIRDDVFAIRLKSNKRLIGIISLFKQEAKEIEIGYCIGSVYWGNGYATEAIKAFISFLFKLKPINTIWASYFLGNDASKRVMEKCGMKYSHIEYNEVEYLGKKKDSAYYRIDRI